MGINKSYINTMPRRITDMSSMTINVMPKGFQNHFVVEENEKERSTLDGYREMRQRQIEEDSYLKKLHQSKIKLQACRAFNRTRKPLKPIKEVGKKPASTKKSKVKPTLSASRVVTASKSNGLKR